MEADDHTDYHTFPFTHFYSLHYTRHFSSPRSPIPLFPLVPTFGWCSCYGSSKVAPELPGTLRSCAARSRRPSRTACTGEQQTRTPSTMAPTDRLEAGASTRHDTRPAGPDLRRARPQRRALPRPLRALLVFHTHTVLSYVDPSRSPSQSRLVHAAADGDDHLTVVPCLAAAYVYADTPASKPSSALSSFPFPLGSATSLLPSATAPPHLCPYDLFLCWCVPVAPDHRHWIVLHDVLPRFSIYSYSPWLLVPSTRPRAPVQARGARAPATQRTSRQHALAHGAPSQGWKIWRGAGLTRRGYASFPRTNRPFLRTTTRTRADARCCLTASACLKLATPRCPERSVLSAPPLAARVLVHALLPMLCECGDVRARAVSCSCGLVVPVVSARRAPACGCVRGPPVWRRSCCLLLTVQRSVRMVPMPPRSPCPPYAPDMSPLPPSAVVCRVEVPVRGEATARACARCLARPRCPPTRLRMLPRPPVAVAVVASLPARCFLRRRMAARVGRAPPAPDRLPVLLCT